jgi:hypothetical protein
MVSLSRMRRPNKRTLLILVAASLLVPAALLSLFGLKLLRDFTEITGGFRAEYGDYVARIAASSVEDAFWEQAGPPAEPRRGNAVPGPLSQ